MTSLFPRQRYSSSCLPTLELDSRLIGTAVLDIVHQVCKEWNLSFPTLMAPKHKIELSLFGMKNNRRKMEDRHALCVDVNSLFSLKVRVSPYDLTL